MFGPGSVQDARERNWLLLRSSLYWQMSEVTAGDAAKIPMRIAIAGYFSR